MTESQPRLKEYLVSLEYAGDKPDYTVLVEAAGELSISDFWSGVWTHRLRELKHLKQPSGYTDTSAGIRFLLEGDYEPLEIEQLEKEQLKKSRAAFVWGIFLTIGPQQGHDLTWLFAAQSENLEKSSSAELVAVINGLNSLLKQRRFDIIDLTLAAVQPSRISPEVMLALARVTYPVRERLPRWHSFVRRARTELDRRGLAAETLLKGLL